MPQQEKSLSPMSPKHLSILGLVIGAILILVIIITSTSAGKPRADSLDGKLETTSAAAIKAHIDLNYLNEGEYAYSYEDLIEEAKPEDKKLLERYRNNLKDFKYSVKGDGKAYQIEYTNVAGTHITVDGNYSEEYR